MLSEQQTNDLEEFCLNYTEPTKNQNFFVVKTSYRIEDLICDWRTFRAENERLKSVLALAVQYLREGKLKFAPDTTNSVVDIFLKDYASR